LHASDEKIVNCSGNGPVTPAQAWWGMDSVTPRQGHAQDARTVAAATSALLSAVALARTLALEGRRLDLSGLEREAAALCDAVMALPRDEAREVLPSLAMVEQEITALMAALKPPA
jgi:hypothetical protein